MSDEFSFSDGKTVMVLSEKTRREKEEKEMLDLAILQNVRKSVRKTNQREYST